MKRLALAALFALGLAAPAAAQTNYQKYSYNLTKATATYIIAGELRVAVDANNFNSYVLWVDSRRGIFLSTTVAISSSTTLWQASMTLVGAAAYLRVGSSVTASSFWGDGAGLTRLDGANIQAGTVDTAALKSDAVTTAKILTAAVETNKLATDAVTTAKILGGAITSMKFTAGAVDTAALGSGAVTVNKILAGAVDTGALGSGAVTINKIFAGAVDTSALGSGAVTINKILAGAVDTNALGSGAVTVNKILSGAVDTNALGTDAVVAAKILNATITSAKFAAGAVDTSALGSGAVTINKILAGAVDTNALGSGAVTLNKLLDGAVQTAKIGVDAVGTTAILNNSVTDAKINGVSGSKVSGNISGNSGTATALAADPTGCTAGQYGYDVNASGTMSCYTFGTDVTVNAGAVTIAAGAVDTGKLGSGAVTINKIGTGAVDTGKLAADAVSSAKLLSDGGSLAKVTAGSASVGNVNNGISVGVPITMIGVSSITTNYIASNRSIGDLNIRYGLTTPTITIRGQDGISSSFMFDEPGAYSIGSVNMRNDTGKLFHLYHYYNAYSPDAELGLANGIQLQNTGEGGVTLNPRAGPLRFGSFDTLLLTLQGAALGGNSHFVSSTYLGGSSVTASGFKGDGSLLTALSGANITALSIDSSKLAKNSVDSEKLVAGSVQKVALGDGAVETAKLAADAVSSAKIVNAAVQTSKLAADAVAGASILNGAVTVNKLGDASVESAKLHADAVTSASILSAAVTVDKIGSAAVDTGKIAPDAVVEAKVLDQAITARKMVASGILNGDAGTTFPTVTISANAIDTAKIKDDSITTAKMLDLNVTTGKLAASAVDTSKLGSDAVTTAKILNLNVTTAKLAASAVDTGKIGADAVGTAAILNGTITSAKFASGAVDTAALGNGAVTVGKLLDGAVQTAKIGSGAVTTNAILAGAVDTGAIGSGAVNTGKLAVDAVTASAILNNTIPSAKMTNVVAAGTTGDGANIPVITYDAAGRITTITTTPNTGPSGSGVSGSGTINKLAKWTPSGTNIGNSLLYDDGLNTGTDSPLTSVSSLTAVGAARFKGAITADNAAPAIFNSTVTHNSLSKFVNTTSSAAVFTSWAPNGGYDGFTGAIAVGHPTSAPNQGLFFLDANRDVNITNQIDYAYGKINFTVLGNNVDATKVTPLTIKPIASGKAIVDFIQTTSTQARFSGWTSGPSSDSDSGAIAIGGGASPTSVMGLVQYDGNRDLSLDNYYDNAAGDIRFRVRTAGTALTPLVLDGAGGATFGNYAQAIFNSTLTVNSPANFSNVASTQAIFSGFSRVGGASSIHGLVQIGGNSSYNGYLDYKNAGDLFTIGHTYDSPTANIQVRMRGGNPATSLVALDILGTGVVTSTNNFIVGGDKSGTGNALTVGGSTLVVTNSGNLTLGNGLATFNNSASTAVVISGWAPISGASNQYGSLKLGSVNALAAGIYMDGNRDLVFSNQYDTTAGTTGNIRFKVRDYGTTSINALTLDAGGGAAIAGNSLGTGNALTVAGSTLVVQNNGMVRIGPVSSYGDMSDLFIRGIQSSTNVIIGGYDPILGGAAAQNKGSIQLGDWPATSALLSNGSGFSTGAYPWFNGNGFVVEAPNTVLFGVKTTNEGRESIVPALKITQTVVTSTGNMVVGGSANGVGNALAVAGSTLVVTNSGVVSAPSQTGGRAELIEANIPSAVLPGYTPIYWSTASAAYSARLWNTGVFDISVSSEILKARSNGKYWGSCCVTLTSNAITDLRMLFMLETRYFGNIGTVSNVTFCHETMIYMAADQTTSCQLYANGTALTINPDGNPQNNRVVFTKMQ